MVKLNEKLSGNTEALTLILEKLDLPNINVNESKGEIRCSRKHGANPTGVLVNTDTLSYMCFSTGAYGSIYSLIMEKLNINFPQSLHWVASVLGLNEEDYNKATRHPFGGFYKAITNRQAEPELVLPKYDESILSQYNNKFNLQFFKDGIKFETQEYFNIGYDLYTQRITIPQYDFYGNIIGIMGRALDDNAQHEYRWLPVIPCSRKMTIYGYYHNYNYIQQSRRCLILESEKSVMQMHSMGKSYRYGLAVAGCSIGRIQQQYIKALRVPEIIIGFDEGLDAGMMENEASKLLIKNKIYKNKVGFIYDKEGKILKAGSKNSPTDLGADALDELINNHVVWI